MIIEELNDNFYKIKECLSRCGNTVMDISDKNISEKIIKTILNTGLVRSVDFVEFNPDLDIDNITLNTCIKLLNIFSNELK